EDGKILWTRTEISVSEHSHTARERYSGPPSWQIEIPVQGIGEQHNGILKNFVEAVLDHKPLLAPAEEGIHSVELANAMLMSAFLDRTIDLPLDGNAFAALLREKIAHSKGAEKLARIPQSVPATDAFGASLHIHPSYIQP
ncbi:MAG: hypothetical protein PHQ12_07400, partial [Chthoniobacteraceae bacterium]|nr:hypothetical protein [Chthoniobacteraceae bacterium]